MIGDLELDVMGKSYDLLKDLNDGEKRRVIQWLVNKFGLLNTSVFQGTIQKLDENSLGGTHPVSIISAPVAKTAPITRKAASPPKESSSNKGIVTEVVVPDLTGYSVSGLFDRVRSKTDVARVLLVAAYLQEKGNGVELGSRQINKELKNIGRGIKNITQAINSLLKKDPQLLKLTRKTTSSQQGKKKYLVTPLGMEKVKESLKSGYLKVLRHLRTFRNTGDPPIVWI